MILTRAPKFTRGDAIRVPGFTNWQKFKDRYGGNTPDQKTLDQVLQSSMQITRKPKFTRGEGLSKFMAERRAEIIRDKADYCQGQRPCPKCGSIVNYIWERNRGWLWVQCSGCSMGMVHPAYIVPLVLL